MTAVYIDPWKDEKYAKIKGDKADDYHKIIFDEAQLHKTDDSYILAGNFITYQGIVRAYKPENPINAGLCAYPIYGKAYEIRKKDRDGNWSSQTIQPSIFEKTLYDIIAANEDDYMPHNAAIKGNIAHIPNGMLINQDESARTHSVKESFYYNQTDVTGRLPEYKPPASGSKGKSWSGSKGLTPEEKLVFLKNQLVTVIKDDSYSTNNSLLKLVSQARLENLSNAETLETYFDLLTACTR